VAVDRLGEAAADGVANRHAREGGEAGRGPRGVVEQGRRDHLAAAALDEGEEAQRGDSKGAEGANGKDDKAHPGRQHAVLGAGGVGGDVLMGSKAGAVGVWRSAMYVGEET